MGRDVVTEGLTMGTAEELHRTGASFIEVRNLVAGYEGRTVVHGLSLAVPTSSHLSLLGPSGCGKSTVLRCIAGLETPQEGEILVDGKTVFSSAQRINIPPDKRRLSMVFQSYAIWPHMSVMENVAFGLKLRGVRGEELRRRVRHALAMVGMDTMIDRPATALSGGQQQRVALARAYAFEPKAILLDEPLSNLDAVLRVQMRDEIKELQRKTSVTTIYVTHDQEEAMAISDRIIVMREGRVEQEGAPLDVYDRPRTRFVADFIGAANILSVHVVAQNADGSLFCRAGEADLTCERPLGGAAPFNERLAAVHAVYPQLAREHRPGPNRWPARVTRRALLGDTVDYTLTWPGGALRVHALPNELFEEGQDVGMHIPADRVRLLDA
ncbi:ABC transporter ATP-binding protein [Methylobacterium sp. J-030]|uniref:ABC transporter ATP-binding protein n=1 Tax=Methylobacterium sp. J-030 TaxID=2836627 RepID=UPI001FB8DE34|nr:ABC transporter ATP-binding protein [Methylobacterium sp. J-030]MCJ2069610.1 ABC transporter ATP-binding protein [Methylobacterium sp. J-030]